MRDLTLNEIDEVNGAGLQDWQLLTIASAGLCGGILFASPVTIATSMMTIWAISAPYIKEAQHTGDKALREATLEAAEGDTALANHLSQVGRYF